MTLLLAGLLAAAMCVPHALRLDTTAPALAAGVWLSALLLRALTAVFAALFVVFFLPTTALFSAITHWCWYTMLPIITQHLPVDGHAVGAVAVVLPAFVLAGSLLSVALGLVRAARGVRRLIARTGLGPGPQASVLLAGQEVLVGAAGLRRPQVVVSAGALATFDEEELAASLEHERGHIARRHRWVLVAAELCRALGRFVPGNRTALRELLFHLERDADRFAIARRHDPAALASAICKAAGATPIAAPAMGLGGGIVVRRVKLLMAAEPPGRGGHERALRVVVATMAGLVLAGAAALPAAAHSGLHVAVSAAATEDGCPA